MQRDHHGFEVIPRDECLALLGSVPVGRLGLSVNALPVVIPVNFALDGDQIVIGSGEGAKLQAALVGAVVAFEADEWDPMSHRGWSVLVQGPARVLDSDDDLRRLAQLPLRPWGRPDELHHIAIEATVVTGRRLDPVTLGNGHRVGV